VDLSVELCGVRLPNPLVLASGVLGATGAIAARCLQAGAGAVTFKSVGLEPRTGHPGPVLVPYEAGWLNAVGLSNPGIEAFGDEFRAARTAVPDGVLVVSVFAHETDRFEELAARADALGPELIELNLSCPNVADEFGRPFALDPAATKRAVAAARAGTKRPLLAKLTATAPDIVAVGAAALDAGADGLVATNTLGPGMAVDVRRRRPVLSNKVGGVSGAAIRPIAVRAVWQLAGLGAPVVGVGGLSTGEHVAEMLMAGAAAVQVGSCLAEEGPAGFGRIAAELASFMHEEGYGAVAELVGLARAETEGRPA